MKLKHNVNARTHAQTLADDMTQIVCANPGTTKNLAKLASGYYTQADMPLHARAVEMIANTQPQTCDGYCNADCELTYDCFDAEGNHVESGQATLGFAIVLLVFCAMCALMLVCNPGNFWASLHSLGM